VPIEEEIVPLFIRKLVQNNKLDQAAPGYR
jgi:hypothetical protein